MCTMFVNPKTGTYEPKPAVFVLKEIFDAPLKERAYAEATVDLLDFVMQPNQTIKRTVPLVQGKKTLPSHLTFSVRATPLREGVALSEVSSGVSVADLADVEETFGDPREVRESATVQQTHQSRQQTTEHVTTREVVTTTTEVTQGYYDEDGTFREETKTREQIVKEAFDESMTAEQRDAYEKMVRERNAAATLERGVRALQDSLRPPEEIEEEDFTEALPARGNPPPSPPRRSARSRRRFTGARPSRRGTPLRCCTTTTRTSARGTPWA